jgi:hypothetical protein
MQTRAPRGRTLVGEILAIRALGLGELPDDVVDVGLGMRCDPRWLWSDKEVAHAR